MRNDSFDSLQSFLDATTSEYGYGRGDDSFFGNVNLIEAKELARNGWSEGLKAIEKFRGKLENVVAKSIDKQEVIYDTCGIDFDMGMVMSGEPECWYDYSPKDEQKTISILYGIGVSGGMSEEQMQIRGAAICSLVDLLESHNIRVELDVFFDFAFAGIYDIITKIRIKQAGQPLDIDRVAFVLMHPGMARKLSFSYCNTVFNGRGREGIGWCHKTPDETGYDLVIRRGFSSFPEYANVNATIEWLKTKLKTFGVNITGGN